MADTHPATGRAEVEEQVTSSLVYKGDFNFICWMIIIDSSLSTHPVLVRTCSQFIAGPFLLQVNLHHALVYAMLNLQTPKLEQTNLDLNRFSILRLSKMEMQVV